MVNPQIIKLYDSRAFAPLQGNFNCDEMILDKPISTCWESPVSWQE